MSSSELRGSETDLRMQVFNYIFINIIEYQPIRQNKRELHILHTGINKCLPIDTYNKKQKQVRRVDVIPKSDSPELSREIQHGIKSLGVRSLFMHHALQPLISLSRCVMLVSIHHALQPLISLSRCVMLLSMHHALQPLISLSRR